MEEAEAACPWKKLRLEDVIDLDSD